MPFENKIKALNVAQFVIWVREEPQDLPRLILKSAIILGNIFKIRLVNETGYFGQIEAVNTG